MPGSRINNDVRFAACEVMIEEIDFKIVELDRKLNMIKPQKDKIRKKMEQFNQLKEERETLRLPFDHYTTKLAAIVEKQGESSENEYYCRNMTKLALHQGYFSNSTENLKNKAHSYDKEISKLVSDLNKLQALLTTGNFAHKIE